MKERQRQRDRRIRDQCSSVLFHFSPQPLQVYWSLALLLPLLVQSLPITEEDLPIDCEDVFRNGSIHSGVYTIYPVGQEVPMEVYCDMGCTDNENHQSHWTVSTCLTHKKNVASVLVASYFGMKLLP